MVVAAVLKSTLPVEPTSRELNSLFIIFNQKCIFYWGILTFKGTGLRGCKVKAIFLQEIGKVQTLRSKFGGFLDWRPPHSEFEGTNPQKAHVSIGTRLLSQYACNSDQNCDLWAGRGNGKNKKKRRVKKLTKPLYFTTTWRHYFATNLHQMCWVCGSYWRYHFCQVWLHNICWFFQADRWKIAFSQ